MARTRTPRRYISLEESAEYLGVSEQTIRRFIANGKLTGYRAGSRMIRVDLHELEGLLCPIPTAGGPNAAA